MPYSFGSTVSATQAADVYAQMATLLTNAGWVKQGADVIDGSFTWRLWTSTPVGVEPAGIAIGVASTGTGALQFRAFEEFVTGTTVRYPVPAYSVALAAVDDGYGKTLHSGSTVKYPVPASQGSSGLRPAVGGDYGIGVFAGNNVQTANATEQTALDGAPHTLDFRSPYLHQRSLNCDDATAVEYAISVTARRLLLSIRRVFNNDRDWMYAGAYEPLTPFDTGQVCMGNDVNGNGTGLSKTRDWSFDGLPMARPVTTDIGGITGGFHQQIGAYGILKGQVEPVTYLNVDIDNLWYSPRGTRVAMGRSTTEFSGLLLDAVFMPAIQAGGVPPIGWGDTMDINGVAHTLFEWPVQGHSLWMPQT